jgi:hypothetical protein
VVPAHPPNQIRTSPQSATTFSKKKSTKCLPSSGNETHHQQIEQTMSSVEYFHAPSNLLGAPNHYQPLSRNDDDFSLKVPSAPTRNHKLTVNEGLFLLNEMYWLVFS